MDNNQFDTLTLAIGKAVEEALSNTHTATIAKVTKIQNSTISAKPVFKRVVNNTEIELPEFSEIPIFTLQGGSNYRIMPISIGDTALLIFNERCIDDWFIGGSDNAKPREYRMHDYSDAIAIVGLNNLKNAINIPDGYEEVQGDIQHTGDNEQTGDYTLNGNQTINNGILTIPPTSDIELDGISLRSFINNHTHGGVQTGSGDTATPNPL